MKLCRKNEILKVSDVKIGMVLTFKGLNELTGPDGDYYDKRKGKRPLFSIGSIGELFFDKKFRIIGPYGPGPSGRIQVEPLDNDISIRDYYFSLSMFKELDINDPNLKWAT